MFDFFDDFSSQVDFVFPSSEKSCPWNFAAFKEVVENVKLYSFF